MKKIITVVGLLCITAASFAFEPASYGATKPGNGSLFGNKSNKERGESNQIKTTKEEYARPGQFALGFRVGAAQNDPETMQEIYDNAFDLGYSEKELTKGYGVFGIEALYEWELAQENAKLGVKAGFEAYSQSKLSLDWGDVKITETTYAFPFTFYYKNDNGIKKWSWFAGAGLTVISSKGELKMAGSPTETESKTKVFPHITAGAEYRFSRVFALGVDVKYNIAAKVKKNEDVLSDRSGIGAAVTGRFYF